MLPADSRLHTAGEFTAVVRRGRRWASPHLVVHLLIRDSGGGPRAGFVVSAKVGNAVVRHRVTRRLRPLVRPLLATLPAGTDLVVRARPPAAGASSDQLDRDLRAATSGALRKARAAAPAAAPVTVEAGR